MTQLAYAPWQVTEAPPAGDHVPFLAPTFPTTANVAEDYAAIVASGIFSNGGPMDQKLTEAVEEWVGGDVRALAVSSCTSGIELAVRATFREAPRALVAAFTFAAGPLALVSAGYRPAFLDIDTRTWQPSLEHARAVLAGAQEEIGGILLTATFGVAIEEIAEWEALAEHYGVPLVIDAAAGLGAEYASGERLGARGTCEVFSIHATKMVAAGEGGIITSRDHALMGKLAAERNFGFIGGRAVAQWGTNAKLQELTAAIGARQMAALPGRLIQRRGLLVAYEAALEPLGVEFQPGALTSAPAFVSALVPVAPRATRLSKIFRRRELRVAPTTTRLSIDTPTSRRAWRNRS